MQLRDHFGGSFNGKNNFLSRASETDPSFLQAEGLTYSSRRHRRRIV